MVIEQEVMQTETPKRLRFIKTEPNSEADLLEEYLGIKFKEKPSKIPLTMLNQLALSLFNGAVWLDIRRGVKASGGLGGKFFSHYNAFIYSPDKDLFLNTYVPLHENMHGFIFQTNRRPSIHNPLSENLSRVVKNNPKDLVEFFDRPEFGNALSQITINACVREGICEWAAFEVHITRSNGVNDLLQSYMFHKFLLYEGKADISVNNGVATLNASDYQKLVGKHYENVASIMDPHFFGNGFKSILNNPSGFKQISRELETAINSHSFYSSGHDFVADVMFYLLQKNLTVAQSLDILINNPPATVAQLRNCDEYCRNLPIPTT